MPTKPQPNELWWEPTQGGMMGSHLDLRMGDKYIGHFYPDSQVGNYRKILKEMVNLWNNHKKTTPKDR
jgi:hypothetical protein